MKGFITHIERETLSNNDYRRVIYTAKHSQLLLMSIEPGGEIGEEVHTLDQFLRFEAGEGKVVLEGEETAVQGGDAVLVPEGTRHNVVNTGSEPLKLYTLYAPPNHKDGVVQHTKADEYEEHFDGMTTE